MRVVNSVMNPYENEPLANAAGADFLSAVEDADGINCNFGSGTRRKSCTG